MPRLPLTNDVINLISLVNTHLQWKNLNGPPRSYEVYHPSAFGSCLRKMQYQRYEERGLIFAPKERVKPTTLRIWDTGNTLHERWVKYFEDIGVLRGVWVCNNPNCTENKGGPMIYGLDNKLGIFKPNKCKCNCNKFSYREVTVKIPDLNMRGNVDQILDFSKFDPDIYKKGNSVPIMFKIDELPKNPIVIDMKSINSFGFKKKLEYGPPFGYKVQVTIYIHALDIDYGLLIFENKDNSELKVDKIDKNDRWWKIIKNQAIQMNEMVEESKLPPPRPFDKTSYECRYCEYKDRCHKGYDDKKSIWNRDNINELRKQFYLDLLEK